MPNDIINMVHQMAEVSIQAGSNIFTDSHGYNLKIKRKKHMTLH